jgi:hypothetical protein
MDERILESSLWKDAKLYAFLECLQKDSTEAHSLNLCVFYHIFNGSADQIQNPVVDARRFVNQVNHQMFKYLGTCKEND